MKITPSKLQGFFGNPRPCGSVLLYGSDYCRVSLYTQKIIDCINAKNEFVIHKFDFSKIMRDPEQLCVELMTMPMFHQKTLILLTDAKDPLTEEFKNAIEKVDPHHSYVIVQAQELTGASALKSYYSNHTKLAAIACYKEDDISHSISALLLKHHVTCDNQAFQHLCELANSGKTAITSELEKLLLYIGESKTFTVEDVQQVCTADLNPALDDLCIAIAEKDLPGFCILTDALLQNKTSPITMIRSIAKYFLRLEYLARMIKSGVTPDQAIKSLRPPVFFKLVPKVKKHLLMLAPHSVHLILSSLFEAEIQCKSLDSTQETVFKHLIGSVIPAIQYLRPQQTNNSLLRSKL